MVAHDAIDHPPWLVVQLAIVRDADRDQFLRNVSPLGKRIEAKAGRFYFAQNAVSRFGSVTPGDEAVKVLDIPFRVLRKENPI